MKYTKRRLNDSAPRGWSHPLPASLNVWTLVTKDPGWPRHGGDLAQE
jgi:hypothetical protein